ncbi:MAG: gamma-glutamyltransferase family protein, partial [Planctomycetota bacterium]|nr:gamma-glutamyltransferase family protein [Planctomycetota bacterium]
DVLEPAAKYAEEGFPLSEVIAWAWKRGGEKLKDQPGFAEVFMPEGRAPGKGEVFRNPALAKTLRTLGHKGRDEFYRGEMAKAIAKFVQDQEGFLGYEDLAQHQSEWVEPVATDYRGYQLWELPPNGQGIAALQILNVLEGYDLKSAGFGSPMHLHLFLEAKKLAFEDRARFYADPDFHKLPVPTLISKEYANERRELIDLDIAAKTFDAGKIELNEGDTIYLTVADKDRNMVSLIQSNYRGFGSGLCPPGLGFCLQDRGQLFALEKDHVNALEPRKRPFHTIIPAFVTRHGKPYMSFGVMGGATQPQGHAQILINMIDFGMNLQEAGDAPRIVHTGSSQPTGEKMEDGGTVHLEQGFSIETRRELLLKGHRLQEKLGVYGGYQAILYDADHDVYYGASDSRKDGAAAGY